MAKGMEQFADEVQVMKFLTQQLSGRSDLDAITVVEQDIKEIFELCSAREWDARQTVRELSSQLQELEAAATYPNPEGLHTERMKTLRREISVAKKLISEMEEDARSAEQARQELTDQLRAVASAAEKEAAAREQEITAAQSKLSMYAAITNTQWKKDEPNMVAGYINDVKNHNFQKFSFDPESVDKFQMINELWELL